MNNKFNEKKVSYGDCINIANKNNYHGFRITELGNGSLEFVCLTCGYKFSYNFQILQQSQISLNHFFNRSISLLEIIAHRSYCKIKIKKNDIYIVFASEIYFEESSKDALSFNILCSSILNTPWDYFDCTKSNSYETFLKYLWVRLPEVDEDIRFMEFTKNLKNV